MPHKIIVLIMFILSSFSLHSMQKLVVMIAPGSIILSTPLAYVVYSNKKYQDQKSPAGHHTKDKKVRRDFY